MLNTLSKTYYKHYTTQLAILFNDLTPLYATEAVVFSWIGFTGCMVNLHTFPWCHLISSYFSTISVFSDEVLAYWEHPLGSEEAVISCTNSQ